MPGAAFTQGVLFTTDTPATAADQNDAWTNVKDYLDPRLAGGLAGELILCDATGNPRPIPLSGDATIDEDGVLSLGVGGADQRGKSLIATEESRTNTVYGTLTTPDQVSNVVLPTDGLIVVAFQARFKGSVAGAASAALHLGATQTTVITASTGPTQDAPLPQGAIAAGTVYRPLFSTGAGLAAGSTGTVDAASDVSTGQIIGSNVSGDGGVCYIFAAAGTYTVSVRFKATSGSVTAKDRKLWVEARGY